MVLRDRIHVERHRKVDERREDREKVDVLRKDLELLGLSRTVEVLDGRYQRLREESLDCTEIHQDAYHRQIVLRLEGKVVRVEGLRRGVHFWETEVDLFLHNETGRQEPYFLDTAADFQSLDF